MRIRRDDIVVAVAGKNAAGGKNGKVLRVLPRKGKAIVEGFSIVKKALRRNQDHPQGGIGDQESPVPLSKLLLYCPECKKGVRVGLKTEGGKKIRKCRKCGYQFDK